jgi:putative FmdB family regulatory protein
LPVYEYICNKCREEFSVSGSYSSLSGYTPVCPKCRSKKITKRLFPVGLIFKGKGFYKTDSGNGE